MKILCVNLWEFVKLDLTYTPHVIPLAKHFTSMPAIYNRIGLNTLPFKTDIVDQLNTVAPAYNPNFTDTFSNVTDQRFHELWQTRQDLPWLLFWSGGIDSTVMLASVIKNTTPEDRQRITVACNNTSIAEHPQFFKNYIKPNFQLVNSSNIKLSSQVLSQYHVLDGGAGDPLYCGRFHHLDYVQPGLLDQNCYTNPDPLINLLAQTADNDQEFGRWFYEATIKNIRSTNIPVETYRDFFWWTYFNFAWTGIKLRGAQHLVDSTPGTFCQFLSNYVQWFESDGYQQWSMNNNQAGVKYGTTLGEYKLVAKKYIYDLDHNEYYLKFKQKTDSLSISTSSLTTPDTWLCMLDDYTKLNLQSDRDQINELLPAHCA